MAELLEEGGGFAGGGDRHLAFAEDALGLGVLQQRPGQLQPGALLARLGDRPLGGDPLPFVEPGLGRGVGLGEVDPQIVGQRHRQPAQGVDRVERAAAAPAPRSAAISASP